MSLGFQGPLLLVSTVGESLRGLVRPTVLEHLSCKLSLLRTHDEYTLYELNFFFIKIRTSVILVVGSRGLDQYDKRTLLKGHLTVAEQFTERVPVSSPSISTLTPATDTVTRHLKCTHVEIRIFLCLSVIFVLTLLCL